jgi:hypothetical protein
LLQILVELADLQDQEVGDGTTSVVILAAELLKRANDLVRAKIHPTSIIAGYRLAMREVRNIRKGCSSKEFASRGSCSSDGARPLVTAGREAAVGGWQQQPQQQQFDSMNLSHCWL